jgi:hypothetical protein
MIGGEQPEARDPGDLGWQRHERPVQHELSARGAYPPETDRGNIGERLEGRL